MVRLRPRWSRLDPTEVRWVDLFTLEIVTRGNKGEETGRYLVDSFMKDVVSDYKWNAAPNGYCKSGPASKNNRGRTYLHHLVVGKPLRGFVVDHISGNLSDNRIGNLRVVTSSQSMMNRGAFRNNTSGVKGVAFDRRAGKWLAHIKVNGSFKNLGLYDEIEGAVLVRRIAEARYFGEYRRIESHVG